MTFSPAIDVVMTCFNEGAFVRNAVQSVLDQTAASRIASISIADDGSDDETRAVLRTIPAMDPRIKVLYGPGQAGVAAQRNRAIHIGNADFIAFLDGDDLWAPEKLLRQLTAMETDPSLGMVFCNYEMFATADPNRRHEVRLVDFTKSDNLAHDYFVQSPTILPSATLLRREAASRIGFFDESVRVFEDTDFFFRLARTCKFGFLENALVYKRIHRNSITESRDDLLAHHSYVAMRAAALEPSLLRFVPHHLSERARKLAVRALIAGDNQTSRELAAFAIRLSVLNFRAWMHGLGIWLAPEMSLRIFRRYRSKQFSTFDARGGNVDV